MSTEVVTRTVVQVVTRTQGPPSYLPEFIGWSVDNANPTEQTSAITCGDRYTLSTSSRYAWCCGDGSCSGGIQATGCSGNYAVSGTASVACGTAYSCLSMTIYKQTPVATVGAGLTRVLCGRNWGAWSVYQSIISTNTTTSEVLSTITTSATPVPLPSTDNGSSKAWIAGVVVGPVVAIALIIGVVLLWLRRRRNRSVAYDAAPPPPPFSPSLDPSPMYYPQSPDPVKEVPQETYYKDMAQVRSSQVYSPPIQSPPLHSTHNPSPHSQSPPPQSDYIAPVPQPHEMSAQQLHPHELATTR